MKKAAMVDAVVRMAAESRMLVPFGWMRRE